MNRTKNLIVYVVISLVLFINLFITYGNYDMVGFSKLEILLMNGIEIVNMVFIPISIIVFTIINKPRNYMYAMVIMSVLSIINSIINIAANDNMDLKKIIVFALNIFYIVIVVALLLKSDKYNVLKYLTIIARALIFILSGNVAVMSNIVRNGLISIIFLLGMLATELLYIVPIFNYIKSYSTEKQ